jgi:hypothetical protein
MTRRADPLERGRTRKLKQRGLKGWRGRRRRKRRGTKGDPPTRAREGANERKPITKLEERRGENLTGGGNDLDGAGLAGNGGITGENATGHGNEREGERRHRNRL